MRSMSESMIASSIMWPFIALLWTLIKFWHSPDSKCDRLISPGDFNDRQKKDEEHVNDQSRSSSYRLYFQFTYWTHFLFSSVWLKKKKTEEFNHFNMWALIMYHAFRFMTITRFTWNPAWPCHTKNVTF